MIEIKLIEDFMKNRIGIIKEKRWKDKEKADEDGEIEKYPI